MPLQLDHEGAAALGAGLAADGAAVALGDLADQGEAEAPAAGGLAAAGRAVERLEDPRLLRRRDAGPAIRHGDPWPALGRPADRDLDRRRAVLDGVFQE